MPITAIGLENFMAFKDPVWVELSKLTLLLGRNSNGKTALIRALRLLKQSLETNNPDQPLQFVVDGGLDVGSFDAVIHKTPGEVEPDKGTATTQEEIEKIEDMKSWSKPLSFMFRGEVPLYSLGADATFDIPDGPQVLSDFGDAAPISFDATIKYQENLSSEKVALTFFEMNYLGVNSNGEGNFLWFKAEFDPFSASPWRATSNLFLEKSDIDLADYFHLQCPNGFLPEIIEGPSYSQLKQGSVEQLRFNGIRELWQVFKQENIKFLENIDYVGPIRPAPERFYLITPETRVEWQRQGANAFLEFLAGEEDDRRDTRIGEWLETFKLGSFLRRIVEYQRKDGLLISSSLVLQEIGHKTNVNLKDVGYGASQIIPVIVQCLAAHPDALIVLEQPELHLHPAAQADVADLLIESLNEQTGRARPRSKRPGRQQDRRESGKQHNESDAERVKRRYLVETHSETLLLRLQLRLAEKSQGVNTKYPLGDTDFNCYFVERSPDNGASSIEKINFDEYGSYGTDTPSGFIDFFGQDNEELLKLMETETLGQQRRDKNGDRG